MKTRKKKNTNSSPTQPFFSPSAGIPLRIQRQEDPPQYGPAAPNLFDPVQQKEALLRGIAEREAPILMWLHANLKRYRLMAAAEIIHLLRSNVSEAKHMHFLRLQALIRQVANQEGFQLSPGRLEPDTQNPLDLSSLTKFKFKLGPASWVVEIPKSLKGRLPVELQGARNIIFSLFASTSGNFEFGIELDALPHLKVSATAGVNPGGNQATSGLRIIYQRTVCQAKNPQMARQKIIKKGRKLAKSVNKLMLSTKPKSGGDQPNDLEKLKEVASAITALYSEVKKAKAPCKQVPMVSVGLEAQTPIERDKPGKDQTPSYLGITINIPF